MYSNSEVKTMIAEWASLSLPMDEFCRKVAEASLGWPYVWGASGAVCTPTKREYYANREVCPAGEKAEIRKKCPVLNGSKGSCSGCTYYPNGGSVLINDCQGWVKWVMRQLGITLSGGGCTSMYNNNSQWALKGEIKDMPKNMVCLVFKQNTKDHKTMEHIGICFDGENIIHCSGTVKRAKLSDKTSLPWSHFAIPKGMGGDVPVPTPVKATIRRGSKGDLVKEAQEKLLALGYDLGSYGADGSFGAKTEAAVKAFQKKHGLTADGVVGAKTWEALDNSEAPVKEQLYTVHIPHVTLQVADALQAMYGGCTIDKE